MIPVAVIGTGSMGKNHVRVYQEMDEAELVAIVDTDSSISDSLSRKYRVPAYEDYFDMLEKENPFAVSVAVPTKLHFQVVRDLLNAGVHVLIEKPISNTLDEAQELILLAQRKNRVLMVGYIERFNPAVVELKRHLNLNKLGRIFQIHARRLGPFPSRMRDVGVVIDLATHDLDIMRYLTNSEIVRVFAESKQELHDSHEDLIDGILRFADGTIGLLELNWLTPKKIRELFVTGERGVYLVNYITQDLTFFENADAVSSSWDTISLLRGISEGKIIQYCINKKEPLRAELEAFVSKACGNESILGNATDAKIALMVAEALIESAKYGMAKELALV